jgi:hypothetical protein
LQTDSHVTFALPSAAASTVTSEAGVSPRPVVAVMPYS